jgi:predicted  nucleic acid-binding Zn-ribbon protein
VRGVLFVETRQDAVRVFHIRWWLGNGIFCSKGELVMQVELALLISIVSVAFSIFFGMKNNKRSDTKEIEERVKTDTIINTKLDNIVSTMQDVKNEIASMRNDIQSHNDRLIKVEESVKQAHKRLDEITIRLDGKDD